MDMNANGLYRWDLNDNNVSQTNFSYAGDKIKSGCIDNQDGKDFKCTEENFDNWKQNNSYNRGYITS